MRHVGSAVWIAALLAATTSASAADDPLPILKEFEFQAGMARLLADRCEDLDFDDNARRIHFLHMDQQLIAIGVNPSTTGVRFSEAGFSELNEAFAARHGFDPDTTLEEFCAAGERERTEETAIGKMLRTSP